ncbi:DNA-protecting protein DprA, partial [Azospirillum brasilense]|nr:DNA-protecting protein DprA [Azospirillum brasilense]
RQGAALVEGVDDVLRALDNLSPPTLRERQGDLFAQARPAPPSDSELEAARAVILENLGHTPVAIDELVRGCQLSAPVVLTVVLELELAGRVQRQPGNQVNLI